MCLRQGGERERDRERCVKEKWTKETDGEVWGYREQKHWEIAKWVDRKVQPQKEICALVPKKKEANKEWLYVSTKFQSPFLSMLMPVIEC